MKIYWIKAQSPRRVLALVKHLGIDAELVQLDLGPTTGLKSAEYSRLNPNLKAPTLVDGDLVLWEASAIMAHLCVQAGSDMWPARNPAEQVQVLRWLSWNDCHWVSALGPFYFEHVVKSTFGLGTPDRASLAPKVPNLERWARVLDEHLADRSFAACGRLTIADFQLGSMATYWRQADMPLGGFSNIQRWLEGLERIPAWADPWPAPSLAA
jgi:glutathione S-transferase